MRYTKMEIWNDLAELRATTKLTPRLYNSEIKKIMNKIEKAEKWFE